MCTCCTSVIPSKAQTFDAQCKAIKYTMLSLGASCAWINKNKNFITIKCGYCHCVTKEQFVELMTSIIPKIGVDVFTIDVKDCAYWDVYIYR